MATQKTLVKIGTRQTDGTALEVTVNLRGEPEAVVKALVHGLPKAVLRDLAEAFKAAIEERF